MRIGTRVRKLAAARRPECRPVELRIEGESEPVTEQDRCPGCGGWHVIVVREVVVGCDIGSALEGGDAAAEHRSG